MNEGEQDLDCEVASSCIEELELEIPEAVVLARAQCAEEIRLLKIEDENFWAEIDAIRREFDSNPLYQDYLSWKNAQYAPSLKENESLTVQLYQEYLSWKYPQHAPSLKEDELQQNTAVSSLSRTQNPHHAISKMRRTQLKARKVASKITVLNARLKRLQRKHAKLIRQSLH